MTEKVILRVVCVDELPENMKALVVCSGHISKPEGRRMGHQNIEPLIDDQVQLTLKNPGLHLPLYSNGALRVLLAPRARTVSLSRRSVFSLLGASFRRMVSMLVMIAVYIDHFCGIMVARKVRYRESRSRTI